MADESPSIHAAETAGDAVLLVGGYGLVGSEVARLLRARHPRLRLLLGGRRPSAGEALAAELGNAACVAVDAGAGDPLAFLDTGGAPHLGAAAAPRPAAVVTVVNDPADRVLLAAVRRGIAVVDITRWTARVHRALVALSSERLDAPVVLASGWMGGLAPIAAAAAAARVGVVDSIFLDILYAMADRSGPDSVAYMDRLAIPFEVLHDGAERTCFPLSDKRRARFAGGVEADTWRLDTPEQSSLPAATGARTVETRIAFDSTASTLALVAMQRLGILALLQRPALTGLRRSLLHVSGPGATARFSVEAAGASGNRVRVEVLDDKGQAHLTAVGAVLSIETALGARLRHDAGVLASRVWFPEQLPAPETLLATASSLGVEISVS